MKKRCQIKFVDFQARAKKDKDFTGVVGLYCPDKNIAYIDKHLPKRNQGSRSLCIKHELVHARTASLDLDEIFGKKTEEEMVELEAITRTEDQALSFAEQMFKRLLTAGGTLNPNVPDDLEKILKSIFLITGIKSNKKIIKMIVTGKKSVEKT